MTTDSWRKVAGPVAVLDVPTVDGRLLLGQGADSLDARVPVMSPVADRLRDFNAVESIGFLDTFEVRDGVLWATGYGGPTLRVRHHVGVDVAGDWELRGDLYVFTRWRLIGVTSHGTAPEPRLWEEHDVYLDPAT